ncbi:MAG: hypothetical protein ABIF01_01585 [Candidatus Micrarchaeota archaeon]
MKQATIQPTQQKPAFSILHPIKSIAALLPSKLAKTSDGVHEPKRTRLSVSFAGALVTTALLAAVVLFFPKESSAKPPPFYKNTSAFTYWLLTPVDGMDGSKTDFWVKEGGAAYKLPLSFSIKGAKISPAVMVLGGVTRCEGVPMAETDFAKLALTINGTSGHYTLSLGARRIFVETKEVSFKAGPRTITIPPETMGDWDFGVRGEWARGRKEPGTVRSIKTDATIFNANQEVRASYWVFSSSVGLAGGWGFSLSGDTKSDNVSLGFDKAFVGGRGKRMLLVGGGYELETNSPYVYVGGMLGPVMVLATRQSEVGDKSYHLLATVDPVGAFNLVTGKGNSKPAHGH